MATFEELMGLPNGIPEKMEARTVEYYKTPAGIYMAIIGRLQPKYKDINGKSCEEGTEGAVFSHCTIPWWLVEYLGTPSEPKHETILGMSLKLPDRKIAELYYPLYVSWNPDDQWKNVNTFQNFELKDDKDSKVIIPNPAKPSMKIVNFKALPKYYGMPIRFAVTTSKAGNPYLDTKNYPITIINDRISLEKMKVFEEEVNMKIQKERAEREADKQQTEYTPPADTQFEETNDLDGFLK
ncbi:MAG: hypothetical protein ACYDBX_04685 [Patescibacteria group bacterium]